ncbi:MAG: hypothetical protein EAZ97_10940 [Bacteroidetes bacterium]|nr:MAG: hypothetical protein EAZ97_10940 [Bacteroidota bacterium]
MFIFILLFLFSLPIFAQEPIIYRDSTDKYELFGKYLQIIEDKNQNLSIEQIASGNLAWKKYEKSLNLQNSVVWAKAKITNLSNKNTDFYVNLAAWDSATLFVFEKNAWKKQQTGYLLNRSQRNGNKMQFLLPIHLEKDSSKTVYFRLLNTSLYRRSPSEIKIAFNSQNDIHQKNYEDSTNKNGFIDNFLSGGIIGICLIMIFYNLILYFAVREKSYLYFVAYLLFLGLYLLQSSPLMFHVFMPESAFFYAVARLWLIALANISRNFFIQVYLQTQIKHKIWHRILNFSTFFIFLNTAIIEFLRIFWQTSFDDLYVIRDAIFGINLGICFLTAWVGYRHSPKANLVFWLALIFPLVAGMFRTFNVRFLLISDQEAFYIWQFGIVICLLIFTFAISNRINLLKAEVAQKAIEQERYERAQEAQKKQLAEEQKAKLEILVSHRTAELQESNEELNQTNEEINLMLEQVNLQKTDIENKNKVILDSIHYAQRIQQAILPTEKTIKQYLPEGFVFYLPKDIVSGDFYWLENIESPEKTIFLAVADCTGHGVSGALMSMLGANILSQIINEQQIYSPELVLHQLDKKIRKQLKQNDNIYNLHDGMDIAFCQICGEKMYFAAAQRPLYILRKGELIEIKGSKNPIGSGSSLYKEKSFTQHEINIEKGDIFYLFSDGFVDQFDETDRKKFGSKKIKDLILSLQNIPLSKQENMVRQAFSSWKGQNKQTDDVILLGFRVR